MLPSFLFLFFLMQSSFLAEKNIAEKSDPTADYLSLAIDTTKSGIVLKDFESYTNGQPTKLYVLKNKNGLEATFTNYGQRLVSLLVPDKEGNLADIVLGFSKLDDYKTKRGTYIGSIVGRYANRIANGRFSIADTTYQLTTNNGQNHSHGGTIGFNKVVWNAHQTKTNKIEFDRISPDMEEGYPGNLKVTVQYTLTNANELQIKYTATTDRPTVVNLSHHSFFNLAGEGTGTINNHRLLINADYYTPVNEDMIPTGIFAPVAGTPFDFKKLKPIQQDLNDDHQQLRYAKGYDHNYVLNKSPKNSQGLVLAAKVTEPTSGRTMDVYTNEPGIQFYGGNFLDGGAVGKSKKAYIHQGGFCLETQHFPDSPNQNNFPSTLLQPKETYTSICVYKFY